MSRDFVRTISGVQGNKSTDFLHKIHIDHILLPLICAVLLFGLAILNSAASGEIEVIYAQSVRIGMVSFLCWPLPKYRDIIFFVGRHCCICFPLPFCFWFFSLG